MAFLVKAALPHGFPRGSAIGSISTCPVVPYGIRKRFYAIPLNDPSPWELKSAKKPTPARPSQVLPSLPDPEKLSTQLQRCLHVAPGTPESSLFKQFQTICASGDLPRLQHFARRYPKEVALFKKDKKWQSLITHAVVRHLQQLGKSQAPGQGGNRPKVPGVDKTEASTASLRNSPAASTMRLASKLSALEIAMSKKALNASMRGGPAGVEKSSPGMSKSMQNGSMVDLRSPFKAPSVLQTLKSKPKGPTSNVLKVAHPDTPRMVPRKSAPKLSNSRTSVFEGSARLISTINPRSPGGTSSKVNLLNPPVTRSPSGQENRSGQLPKGVGRSPSHSQAPRNDMKPKPKQPPPSLISKIHAPSSPSVPNPPPLAKSKPTELGRPISPSKDSLDVPSIPPPFLLNYEQPKTFLDYKVCPALNIQRSLVYLIDTAPKAETCATYFNFILRKKERVSLDVGLSGNDVALSYYNHAIRQAEAFFFKIPQDGDRECLQAQLKTILEHPHMYYLVHDYRMDQKWLQASLRVTLPMEKITDTQVVFKKWWDLNAMIQRKVQCREWEEKHWEFQSCKLFLIPERGQYDPSRINLNQMLDLCHLPLNSQKRAPRGLPGATMLPKSLIDRIEYAAFDVDQLTQAYSYMLNCIRILELKLNLLNARSPSSSSPPANANDVDPTTEKV
jgi:hypothetical protein